MKSLITSPSFEYLGDELRGELDITKSDVSVGTFPDGTPKINIVKEDVENTVATVLLDFSDCREFLNNYMLLHGLVDKGVESLNIIMPYFPVGTMERAGKPEEVATAHAYANLMMSLPTGKSGRKNNLHIFDIHAEVEEFMFGANNRINLETHSMLSYLREELEDRTPTYPDAGAAKRYSQEIDSSGAVICSKERVGDKRVIKVIEGSPEGKDVTIIDDLVQSGKTTSETAVAMKKLGAKSVNSIAIHGVCPNDSHIQLAKSVDKLIVTDSIPANIQRAESINNMEIVSIKELVKKIILEN